MCQVGHLDPSGLRNVLMKTGLILLIVGHLNFITGALVHGSVLRFVVTARDATSLHYGVTNSASVIAALLIISCGVSALLLSRYLSPAALGRALLAPCSSTASGLAPVSRECPFDPTRVYSSTLSLWAVSLLLEAMGIFFSVRCLLLTLELLRLGRCCRGMLRMKLSLQEAPVETPEPGQCLALLRLDSGETARL
uniref:transmembrane protein 54 n=1 Tax=Lonchura striata TaxID=40157 RepID=UPI0012937C49|nr:transmembrane protein 54 [Lonchura striata domestica]